MNTVAPPAGGLPWAAPLPVPASIPPPVIVPLPANPTPRAIRDWFDSAAEAAVPAHDGTTGTARVAADAYARRAKADNTRRAYRAAVRAWCKWCASHELPCLPARAADVVAFLAAERGSGLSVNTVELRRAAIRYLHFIAGLPIPTAEAHVAATLAGIPDDLAGLRDRALLLVGFAGALRRAELAAIRVEHLEASERGLRLTLPRSKDPMMAQNAPGD